MNKKDIIERLYKAGHINFDEMLLLAKEEKEYILQPQYVPSQPIMLPINPYPQWMGHPNGITWIEA